MQQPPRQQARPWCEAIEQRARQARSEQHLAHQDEERQCKQLLRRQDIPGVLRHQLVDWQVAEDEEEKGAGQRQRQSDPNADGK